MNNATKIACFIALLLVTVCLVGCKSSKQVVQGTVVDRVGERVEQRQRQVDSTSVARHDSVTVYIADSVKEIITVDTAGNILKHEIYHNTNRNREAYRLADNSKTIRHDNDSKSNRDSSFVRRDSVLKAASEITDFSQKQTASSGKTKQSLLSRVGDWIKTRLAWIGVFALIILVFIVLRKTKIIP